MAGSKISDLKKEIRRQIRTRREELSRPEASAIKETMDAKIRNQLVALLDELRKKDSIPDTVYCYASFGGEVDTFRLMEELLKKGYHLALPRVTGERMDFYLVPELTDLTRGFRGILEPAGYCKRADSKKAAVITPGTAFTKRGDRMGYGGGFYDRFFSEEPEHKKIAICYPFQIFSELPTEKHDKRMDLILTGEIKKGE